MKKYILILFLGLMSITLSAQNTVMKYYAIKTLYSATTAKSDSITVPIQAGAIWSLQVVPVRSGTDSVYASIKGYTSNTDSTVMAWTPIRGFNDNATYVALAVQGDTLVTGNASNVANNAWTYNSPSTYFQNLRLKFVIKQLTNTHKSVQYKFYFVAKIPIAALGTH